MRNALDLFSWEGRVTRRAYLIAGLLLFAAKYPVDFLISKHFGHAWNPLMYLSPRVSPLFHPGDDRHYWLALLAWSVPFMWAGISLSARRLRDIGVHPFWSGLFFLPFLHFAFFLVLLIAPPHQEPAAAPTPDKGPFRASDGPPLPSPAPPRLLTRVIPRSQPLAYLFALSTTLGMGLLCYIITVQVNSVLGTGLFIGLPFGMGFWVAFCMTYNRPSSGAGIAILYGLSSVLIALVVLLAAAWEGLACLIMAFPILFLVAAFGAWIGWLCARQPPLRNMSAAALLLLVPTLVGADLVKPPKMSPMAVVSTVTVRAPAAEVWNNVISFPPIDSRPAPIFAIVGMPIEARIDGRDPGATRRCIFTNGTFVEPIEKWDAPRELRFGVEKQPDNLGEYIDIVRGQFLLTENSDGTTTLKGTTWYQLKVFPTAYWGFWANTFLHAIHIRVLDHIKKISEDPSALAAARAAAPAPQPDWMATSNATCACTRHKNQ